MRSFKTYLSTYAPALLVLAMLCIALGPTMKSIGISIAAAGILLSPQYRPDLRFIFTQPITWMIIALCGISILGCIWSIASPAQQISMVEKYCKLLYLPLFAAGFTHKKIRHYAIHAYLLGICITCSVSLYCVHSDPGSVFYNHIITGYMVAFAAYLAAWLAISTQNRWYKMGYAILILIYTSQLLFLNTGRTGIIVYAMLFLLFFLQNMSSKPLLYVILSLAIGFVVLIQFIPSNKLMQRAHMGFQDMRNYQLGQKNSSVGFRLQFHHYAKQLFLSKPFMGYGTGSFTPQYFKDNPIPEWDQPKPDPHSQYWLTASELGLLGILVLFLILGWLSKLSFELQEMKPILQAVLLPFCVVNYSDGLLTTSGIGYLFITFTGLCLGELIELKRNHASRYNCLMPRYQEPCA
ncbi:MAG: O-antigen ligase family protein [Legionellales bacterium]|nr:O-antigen ligase family protein [Legionellales bacterium]